jgi:SHS2 domain-containing protein
MMKKFKFLEHTADVKFQAYGKNLKEVYENSGLAFISLVYQGKIKNVKTKKIKLKGKDLESLMYNFLEEILFLIDSEGFLAGNSKVKIDEKKKELVAEFSGDNIKNYKAEMAIKAVTYNEMFVKKTKSGWVSQVVLDV